MAIFPHISKKWVLQYCNAKSVKKWKKKKKRYDHFDNVVKIAKDAKSCVKICEKVQ